MEFTLTSFCRLLTLTSTQLVIALRRPSRKSKVWSCQVVDPNSLTTRIFKLVPSLKTLAWAKILIEPKPFCPGLPTLILRSPTLESMDTSLTLRALIMILGQSSTRDWIEPTARASQVCSKSWRRRALIKFWELTQLAVLLASWSWLWLQVCKMVSA